MRIIDKQLKLGIAAVSTVGKLKTKRAKNINFSPFGIGLEKADGGYYDPSAVYRYINELSVKWVRIQSGWARCEKQCGVYDFSWLDEIIDNILRQGAKPWICLCYGNPIYDVRAPENSRACGYPPIISADMICAWKKYVESVVVRYRGKVNHYEIWNEPDGTHCWKSGVNGKEYGEFVSITSAIIRNVDKDCRIIAGSMCNMIRLKDFCEDAGVVFDEDVAIKNFFTDWLSVVSADAIDFVSVHLYRVDPEGKANKYFAYLRSELSKLNPKIGIIQGETGTHAGFSRIGALNSFEWTQRKQAKFSLRRMYTDFVHDVYLSSYFSLLDMYENLNNENVFLTKENFGLYGVLAAEFDERGIFTGSYRKKQSFFALQALNTVFSDGVKKIKNEFEFVTLRNSYWGGSDVSDHDPLASFLVGNSFESASGKRFEVFYMATSILNIEYEGTVSVVLDRVLEQPAFVDLISGKVFPILADNVSREGMRTTIFRLPLKDYPCLLIDLKETDLSVKVYKSYKTDRENR